MSKRLLSTIVIPILLLLAACSEPANEADVDEEAVDAVDAADSAAESEPKPGTATRDPVVVDPDRYAVEFENDAVRVLRINYDAGDESVMHYHPDSVAVYLDDVEGEFTLPDGAVENASAPAGSLFFGPAGSHQPRNLGDSAFEVIEVELKSRQAPAQQAGGPDPTIVDPDHYAIEFENDAVRVLRINYGPGEESVMHYHPDGVAVFLSEHLVEMAFPDGSVEEVSAAAGDTLYLPAGEHLPRNIADAPVEVVLVELKQ